MKTESDVEYQAFLVMVGEMTNHHSYFGAVYRIILKK